MSFVFILHTLDGKNSKKFHMFEFLFFRTKLFLHYCLFSICDCISSAKCPLSRPAYCITIFYGLCNYLHDVIRFDTVRRLAVSHNYRTHTWGHAFRCLLYPVDIHFATAISAIHQSCEWVCFAPAVGITPYLSSDTLNIIKGFLVDNRRMSVLKD